MYKYITIGVSVVIIGLALYFWFRSSKKDDTWGDTVIAQYRNAVEKRKLKAIADADLAK